jgi:hypothetical protein
MAQIIEFYVPSSFRKTATKWIPPGQRGKVIPFDLLKKKSARIPTMAGLVSEVWHGLA